MPDLGRHRERTFHGIPVSPGVCHGKVFVLGKPRISVPNYSIEDSEVPHHMDRLQKALMKTRQQIHELQHQVAQEMGSQEALVFDAHLLLLDDCMILGEVTKLIRDEHHNAEHAFHIVAEKYARMMEKIEDELFRERLADIRDVTSRILMNLQGNEDSVSFKQMTEPCLVVSHDLEPSVTAQFDKTKVLGFATDIGSRTSHTAIFAKSLQIPAVVGLRDMTEQLVTGDTALIDGYNGMVILNPTDQTLFEYGQVVRQQNKRKEKFKGFRDLESRTLDGVPIQLSANLEQPKDAKWVKENGGLGVGLFRTEYLFLNRDTLPTEEEQYQAYKTVAEALAPDPVIIRTLDLGGDKLLSHLHLPQEMNPFLGWRAIRYCLQEETLFKAQLRAILRASASGNVKIMYPMISGVVELEQANERLEAAKVELRLEGKPFDEGMEIGAMIEVPSAVMIADSLAKRVQFLSIGTNDLIQYTLAVDRLNEKIAHLYEPTHPAIVRSIKASADAANRHSIWLGVCGEMAGDPMVTPLLLGLGVTELSTAPSLIPPIKYLIRRLNFSDAKKLADIALQCETGSEILQLSQELSFRIAPDLFEGFRLDPTQT